MIALMVYLGRGGVALRQEPDRGARIVKIDLDKVAEMEANIDL